MTLETTRKVAYDCRYFLGDRPCIWHKREGALCECEHYSSVESTLLIIKLDAMGDVLRTTCLLPVIDKTWPRQRITWVTRPESTPLLQNNPYISEVVPYGPDALVLLASRTFDRLLNLDAGKVSAGIATIADAKEKIGYVLHNDGYVVPTNRAAEDWLQMGVFDDLKKANRRSYQEIMCSICGFPTDGLRYVLELTSAEEKEGRRRLVELDLDLEKNIIGIHTGGGERWRLKQWNEQSFIGLIQELQRDLGHNIQILLFGGPRERNLNRRIIYKVDVPVFDAGCDNPVRLFAALAGCCTVMLSGDSLAMHVALALGRRVVVLFGPTSSTEIELFGLGEKVIPDMDCLACYKEACDFVPNCMDSITVQMVKEAILRQLDAAICGLPKKTSTFA